MYEISTSEKKKGVGGRWEHLELNKNLQKSNAMEEEGAFSQPTSHFLSLSLSLSPRMLLPAQGKGQRTTTSEK